MKKTKELLEEIREYFAELEALPEKTPQEIKYKIHSVSVQKQLYQKKIIYYLKESNQLNCPRCGTIFHGEYITYHGHCPVCNKSLIDSQIEDCIDKLEKEQNRLKHLNQDEHQCYNCKHYLPSLNQCDMFREMGEDCDSWVEVENGKFDAFRFLTEVRQNPNVTFDDINVLVRSCTKSDKTIERIEKNIKALRPPMTLKPKKMSNEDRLMETTRKTVLTEVLKIIEEEK